MLGDWKINQQMIAMTLARKMGIDDQKLLANYMVKARQSLKDALDMAKKEKAIEKDAGKGGPKGVGM